MDRKSPGRSDRLGLRERLYASGDQKAESDILSPNTVKQDEAARELVDTVGAMFREDVRARRGDRLKETADMWSGRTWVAGEAKALGLIDEVGVYESAYRAEFGELPEFKVSARSTLEDTLNLEDVTNRLAGHVTSELTVHRLE
jgi:protease-4